MQVYTKDGIVFARAESITDIETLMKFRNPKGGTSKTGEVTTTSSPKAAKKSYKKQYMKTCEDCGRKCKGNIGLANHKCIKKEEESEFAGPYSQKPVAHPTRIPVVAS